MSAMFIHNEWYDKRTGAQVIARCLDACYGLVEPQTVHVIHNPHYSNPLDHTGDEFGEADIWWTVGLIRPTDYRAVVESIRNDARIRVKTAGMLPDGWQPSHSEFFEWLYKEDDDATE